MIEYNCLISVDNCSTFVVIRMFVVVILFSSPELVLQNNAENCGNEESSHITVESLVNASPSIVLDLLNELEFTWVTTSVE